jgi:hypothetical protein
LNWRRDVQGRISGVNDSLDEAEVVGSEFGGLLMVRRTLEDAKFEVLADGNRGSRSFTDDGNRDIRSFTIDRN